MEKPSFLRKREQQTDDLIYQSEGFADKPAVRTRAGEFKEDLGHFELPHGAKLSMISSLLDTLGRTVVTKDYYEKLREIFDTEVAVEVPKFTEEIEVLIKIYTEAEDSESATAIEQQIIEQQNNFIVRFNHQLSNQRSGAGDAKLTSTYNGIEFRISFALALPKSAYPDAKAKVLTSGQGNAEILVLQASPTPTGISNVSAINADGAPRFVDLKQAEKIEYQRTAAEPLVGQVAILEPEDSFVFASTELARAFLATGKLSQAAKGYLVEQIFPPKMKRFDWQRDLGSLMNSVGTSAILLQAPKVSAVKKSEAIDKNEASISAPENPSVPEAESEDVNIVEEELTTSIPLLQQWISNGFEAVVEGIEYLEGSDGELDFVNHLLTSPKFEKLKRSGRIVIPSAIAASIILLCAGDTSKNLFKQKPTAPTVSGKKTASLATSAATKSKENSQGKSTTTNKPANTVKSTASTKDTTPAKSVAAAEPIKEAGKTDASSATAEQLGVGQKALHLNKVGEGRVLKNELAGASKRLAQQVVLALDQNHRPFAETVKVVGGDVALAKAILTHQDKTIEELAAYWEMQGYFDVDDGSLKKGQGADLVSRSAGEYLKAIASSLLALPTVKNVVAQRAHSNVRVGSVTRSTPTAPTAQSKNSSWFKEVVQLQPKGEPQLAEVISVNEAEIQPSTHLILDLPAFSDIPTTEPLSAVPTSPATQDIPGEVGDDLPKVDYTIDENGVLVPDVGTQLPQPSIVSPQGEVEELPKVDLRIDPTTGVVSPDNSKGIEQSEGATPIEQINSQGPSASEGSYEDKQVRYLASTAKYMQVKQALVATLPESIVQDQAFVGQLESLVIRITAGNKSSDLIRRECSGLAKRVADEKQQLPSSLRPLLISQIKQHGKDYRQAVVKLLTQMAEMAKATGPEVLTESQVATKKESLKNEAPALPKNYLLAQQHVLQQEVKNGKLSPDNALDQEFAAQLRVMIQKVLLRQPTNKEAKQQFAQIKQDFADLNKLPSKYNEKLSQLITDDEGNAYGSMLVRVLDALQQVGEDSEKVQLSKVAAVKVDSLPNKDSNSVSEDPKPVSAPTLKEVAEPNQQQEDKDISEKEVHEDASVIFKQLATTAIGSLTEQGALDPDHNSADSDFIAQIEPLIDRLSAGKTEVEVAEDAADYASFIDNGKDLPSVFGPLQSMLTRDNEGKYIDTYGSTLRQLLTRWGKINESAR